MSEARPPRGIRVGCKIINSKIKEVGGGAGGILKRGGMGYIEEKRNYQNGERGKNGKRLFKERLKKEEIENILHQLYLFMSLILSYYFKEMKKGIESCPQTQIC